MSRSRGATCAGTCSGALKCAIVTMKVRRARVGNDRGMFEVRRDEWARGAGSSRIGWLEQS